jgi:hypothetical protein
MLLRLCARLPSDLRSRTLPASSAPISPAKTLIPETGKPSTIPLTTFVARPQDLKQWPLLNQGLRRVLATRPMSLTYDQASDRRVAGSFRATLTNPSYKPVLQIRLTTHHHDTAIEFRSPFNTIKLKRRLSSSV